MSGILAGKRAYVTGGSSGIGAGIVKTFAAEGARVAIGASRHADEARAMAKDPAGQQRQSYRGAGRSLRPAAD